MFFRTFRHPLFILSFLGLFFFLPLIGLANPERDALIEDHYQRGYDLSESKEFSRALLELNLAMRHMRHLPRHPRRIEVEKLILRTKERMVLERYLQSNESSIKKDDHLLPLKFEPDHFRVRQIYGKVYIRKIWKDRETITAKEYIGEGRQVSTLPHAGIELEESRTQGFILRAVDAAGLSLLSSNSLELHSGCFSICSNKYIPELMLKSSSANLSVSSRQPFALFVEVGTDGHLHATSLLGEIKLQNGDDLVQILPGERCESTQYGLNQIDDMDLGSHFLRSKLLGKFQNPPIFYGQLVQQARIQIRRSRVSLE